MTPNKEDYLKALYNIGGVENLVSNKQIAQALQIAPASVTEMLVKLKREGLIHYEPYKGSRLVNDGITLAISLVRGHRLWEVFLMRHLGYSWSEAHEDAELLEHITPARLTNRLDQFLDHPTYCPHGNLIPHSDGQVEPSPEYPLNFLPLGVTSHIRRVTEDKELMDIMQEAGITIGSLVSIIETSKNAGPLTLELDGKQIQISYQVACQIYVDRTDE